MLALTQLSRYLMDMAMGQHDGVVVQHSLDLIGKKQDSSPPHPPPNEHDAELIEEQFAYILGFQYSGPTSFPPLHQLNWSQTKTSFRNNATNSCMAIIH